MNARRISTVAEIRFRPLVGWGPREQLKTVLDPYLLAAIAFKILPMVPRKVL